MQHALGGWIAFRGGGDGAGDAAYDRRGPGARALVVAAGPVANALAAVALFAALLAAQGRPVFLAVADRVLPGSAAERAGFREGDRILRVDGTPVAEFEDLRPALRAGAGRAVAFEVERGGEALVLTAVLDAAEEGGRTIGVLGVRTTTPGHLPLGPGEVLAGALARAWGAARDTVVGIAGLVRHGEGRENLAGPVGVAVAAGEAAAAGWATLLALAAILSANIALMNLLPLPVLDGGQLLLLAAEGATGRPVPERARAAALRLSVGLLVALLLLTTANDLHGLLGAAPPQRP